MTYADKVKAEVEARYGVPVHCDVRIILCGVSGLPEFDPFRLFDRPSRISGARSVDEAALMRQLRASGKTRAEIAKATGRSMNSVFRATCHM